MALRSIRQVRIHDIDRLAEIVEQDGVELPVDRDRLDVLTQYAVPLRYEDLLDAEPLDREATIALVREVERWAEDAIESTDGSGDDAAEDDGEE